MAELYEATVASWQLTGRKSFDDLRRRWRSVLEYFGAEATAEVLTYDRLARYAADRLKQGVAPATILKELNYLHIGCRLMERSERMRTPVFPTIRVKNARQVFIEDHEYEAIERELPEDLRPFFRFKFLTGWRNAEVASLTWTRNVDWKQGVVRLLLYETKTGEAREFPFRFLPALERLMREQRARTDLLERRTGRVIPTVFWRDSFKSRGGSPVKLFRAAWRAARERAGYPDKTPHDFRRTAVRRLELAGVPRSIAMKLVGHQTERMYTRYAICPPQDLLEGVKRLARYMDKPCESEPNQVKPEEHGYKRKQQEEESCGG